MDTTPEKRSKKGLLQPKVIAVFALATISLMLSLIFRTQGKKNARELISLAEQLVLIMPAILIFIGLFAEWAGADFIEKYLGDSAGVKGLLASFAFPLLIPIPLFMALPIGNIIFNKKARLAFVYSFFGAMAFSITSLLFEAQFMGTLWMATRLALSVPIVILLCFLAEWWYNRARFGKPIPEAPSTAKST